MKHQLTGRRTPFDWLTGRKTPVDWLTGCKTPIDWLTGRKTQIDCLTGRKTPTDWLTGRKTPIDWLTGRRTPVDWFTGRKTSIYLLTYCTRFVFSFGGPRGHSGRLLALGREKTPLLEPRLKPETSGSRKQCLSHSSTSASTDIKARDSTIGSRKTQKTNFRGRKTL